MRDNVVIDTPARLDEDIEDFKIDAVDDEKNFTVSRVKLCREPDSDKPILFYTQELSRNFKNPHNPFGKRHVIKAFTPSNFTAVVDETLQRKYQDVILAHKPAIKDYSPLTDIHSQQMNLFLDEDNAVFLADIGINVDGLGEDFQSIESVSATPFMEEVAVDVSKLKTELAQLRNSYRNIKHQMADEFKDDINPDLISDDEFAEQLTKENIPTALVKSYLSIKEQINQLQNKLGEVSDAVFSETSAKIKLPGKEISHESLSL